MSMQLMIASLAITAALAFYTVGVFTERRRGRLSGLVLALFWIGLIFDTTGTTVMAAMAHSAGGAGAPAIHGVTGALAIALMLFHAGWATLVSLRGRGGSQHANRLEQVFHRFSTAVWLVWLIPYLIGMLVGMPALRMNALRASATSLVIVIILALLLFRPATRDAAD